MQLKQCTRPLIQTYNAMLFLFVSPERPMHGQKARPQTRLPSLPCTTLKSPGRLPGSSPPTSINQVTFKRGQLRQGHVSLVFRDVLTVLTEKVGSVYGEIRYLGTISRCNICVTQVEDFLAKIRRHFRQDGCRQPGGGLYHTRSCLSAVGAYSNTPVSHLFLSISTRSIIE